MSAHQLLTRLLNYVVEQSKDIDPRGFKLSNHKGFLKSKPDIQGLPGVDFDIKVEGDHAWLRVARLEANPPPGLNEKLKGLVIVDDNPSGQPPRIDEVALRHRLASGSAGKTPEEKQVAETNMRAALALSLAEYSPLWSAWAAGEKPRRKTIALYGDFFSIKHQLESEETAKPHELVWGIGVAAWKLKYEERSGTSTVDFQYPLLTQAVELALDERTLAIELRPRSIEPRLEFDAFAACQLTSVPDVEKAAKEALTRSADRPVSPFDPGTFEHVLKLIAGNLHERGRYVPEATQFPLADDALSVSDCWVILARPRANNYLHEDIERLKGRLQAGISIPLGPLALVTPPSDEVSSFEPVHFRGLSGGSGSGGGKGAPQELFFPLPYNHEQVTIVEQLERSAGVAVQGPPGTGKTHTIANIICHYLATGRKVLVTAKGEQALEVLQSKIPEDVRPLTVALLAGDREGMRQFQSSIEAIIHNVSQLNPDVVRTQIATAHSAIDQAHRELAQIDRRVDEIALTQLSEIEVDGVTMRAQKMAELVLSGEIKYQWFDDELSLAPIHAPPLDAAQTGKLREARRGLGKDLIYATARIPSSAGLLPAADVGRLHEVMVRMREIEAAEARGGLLALRATTPEVLDAARKLLTQVEVAAHIARELEESGDAWTAELRRKCGQSTFLTERRALEALFGEIDELIAARAEFLKRPVEMPEPALASPKVREAIGRGAETGKVFGLFSFAASDVKEHVNAVRVSGLAPSSTDDWQHVQQYVLLHEKVLSFSVRWNEFAELLSVPTVRGGVTGLRQIELISVNARKAHLLAVNHDAHLPSLAERVFTNPPVQQLRGGSVQLAEVRQHLRSHLTRAELAQAATLLATLKEKLAGTSGPVSLDLRTFVDQHLGDSRLPTERIVGRYAELVSEVRRVEGIASYIAFVNDCSKRFEEAGAAKFAHRVRFQAVEGAGEDATFPAAWRDAWNWARVKAHLNSIEARDELRALAARRRDLEAGLARLYENVVSKAAWLATKIGASPKVLSALETYRTAVRRIGQGTGPNATRHRRDAQKAMHDAQGAVPCWVMSHSKVSETLPATLGAFDLVIVDEASQSDLWALPAVLRGKKVLVVGDDKQVSPDGSFMSSVRIQELKDRFLSDQPYAPILTPEKSLYDIASTVYAESKVMLREHFRCVPPIIAYSNRTFYKDFIQPLRIPKASERIDPPLVDIFVPSGMRDAHDLNRAEAAAIADEIEAILLDPKFKDRTIGVVSLLGPEQAKHVDQLVRSRCDAAELLRRKFDCGDARLFQGSERDIMFLSVVASPRSCRALSGNMFEQRFNVAASRARDRMYLVRSVELKDLSPTDLRIGLLSHFSKPLDGGVIESKNLIELCESGFERQVYSEMFNRGYRVIPQVKAGSFRIDMVVEGANDSRLAIECDGDEFHGPDRWQADMGRQRVLERAGWTFWRCFASTWSLRKDDVLHELLDRLAAMGIDPVGALERVPSLVETRLWKPKAEPSVDGKTEADRALEAAIAKGIGAPK
jgi:very-short-patch-repair endonuclease